MNPVSTPFDVLPDVHSGTMSLKRIRITRLRQFAKARGVDGPVELGKLISRKPNQVSDLLSGRASFGEKVARSIEEAAGLPRDWLDRLDEGSEIPAPTPSSDAVDVTIPQYDTGGAMGAVGLVLRDQPGMIRSWHVTPEWIAKNVHSITSPRHLAVVTGFGDSMRPLYNPGDPLLVDTGVKSVDFDGIYFFRVGNEGFVKRLQRIPGIGLRAISENKAYESWDIKDGMDFEVFARVVKVWKGEDF
jgi:phage repressor protein C with HTH and peptisase S24 domain